MITVSVEDPATDDATAKTVDLGSPAAQAIWVVA
jgi:hypothetical protein